MTASAVYPRCLKTEDKLQDKKLLLTLTLIYGDLTILGVFLRLLDRIES